MEDFDTWRQTHSDGFWSDDPSDKRQKDHDWLNYIARCQAENFG